MTSMVPCRADFKQRQEQHKHTRVTGFSGRIKTMVSGQTGPLSQGPCLPVADGKLVSCLCHGFKPHRSIPSRFLRSEVQSGSRWVSQGVDRAPFPGSSRGQPFLFRLLKATCTRGLMAPSPAMPRAASSNLIQILLHPFRKDPVMALRPPG